MTGGMAMLLQQEYEQLKQQIDRYDAAGDYVGLAKEMDRFLDVTGQLYGENSPEYAATLNDYGGIHRDIGNYEKAEQAFLQAADKIAQLQGQNHPDYGSVLNNLAGLYRLMKRYDASAEQVRKTLEIYRAALGEQHFLYISGMNNLGLLYQDMGRYAEAEELHSRSLALLEQAGDNPIAIATTLTNLASARRQQNRLDGVVSLLERALRMYETYLGREHSLYAYGLNNLASYYMTIGQYDNAAVYYQSALKLCEILFGVESRNYQISLQNYEIASRKAAEQRGQQ